MPLLEITVKYFLTEEGVHYFSDWYNEVYKMTSKQDGFLRMSLDKESSNIPIVTLYFENQEKLTQWVKTDIHAELVSKLEPFQSKPREVERKEIYSI